MLSTNRILKAGPFLAMVLFCLTGCGGRQDGGDPDPDEGAWAVRIESADQLLEGRTARGRIGDY